MIPPGFILWVFSNSKLSLKDTLVSKALFRAGITKLKDSFGSFFLSGLPKCEIKIIFALAFLKKLIVGIAAFNLVSSNIDPSSFFGRLKSTRTIAVFSLS